jgi:hypothetical protein
MKTLFTIMAYCYMGRWLYLEACVLLPDLAPYLQSTLESLDPPTHDRISEIINSYSIREVLDQGIKNLKPHHNNAEPESESSRNSEELSEGYF